MARPKNTYALVVGIEKYKDPILLPNLDGPANDAIKFANWLESKGVPKKNIFFCLSPLDKKLSVLDPENPRVWEATEGGIKDAITEISKINKDFRAEKVNLLFLFWGGHGTYYQDTRRFFCADADEYNMPNINYTELQKKIDYDVRPNKEIHLIDACANDFRKDSKSKLPSSDFQINIQKAGSSKRIALFAADRGEYASNLAQQGLFSKEVLALLNKDHSWPPDMNLLASKINAIFQKLRRSKKAKQTPCCESRNWDHDAMSKNEEERLEEVLDETEKDTLSRHVPHSRSDKEAEDKQNDKEEGFIEALLGLNYKDQVKTFRLFNTAQHHTGAFLIHGKPYNGQRFLLNQLSRYIPMGTEDEVIPINLYRRGLPVGIDFVWHRLAQSFRPTGRSSPQYIARHLNKALANRNVILIIHDIDTMPPQFLNELLDQFWEPLLKSLGTTNRRDRKCLIMFVVDYTGRTTTADIKHTEKVDSKYKPHILVKLKEVRAFSENLLKNWFDNNAYRLLPNQLIDQEERILQDILATKKKDGIIPEEALQQVCHSCNYNWYQKEKQWFKL